MEASGFDFGRLNMAARAVVSRQFVARIRWIFLGLNAVLAFLAVWSPSPLYGPWFLPVVFVSATFATLVLWSDWRYRLYPPAAWYIVVGLGTLAMKSSDTTYDRVHGAVICGILATAILWRAFPLATVDGPGWEKEQSLVETWWGVLTSAERRSDVIEFNVGSFWKGYYTYRLMKPGPFWVVAGIYKGQARELTYFRILKIGDVVLPLNGEHKVRIGRRTMHVENLQVPA